MARQSRGEVIYPDQVQIVHCIERCVRCAFLCGEDPYTGQSFQHRRSWIRERLEFLASCFAIDCLTFSIMSNHWRLVLRPVKDRQMGRLLRVCVECGRPYGTEEWTEEFVERHGLHHTMRPTAQATEASDRSQRPQNDHSEHSKLPPSRFLPKGPNVTPTKVIDPTKYPQSEWGPEANTRVIDGRT